MSFNKGDFSGLSLCLPLYVYFKVSNCMSVPVCLTLYFFHYLSISRSVFYPSLLNQACAKEHLNSPLIRIFLDVIWKVLFHVNWGFHISVVKHSMVFWCVLLGIGWKSVMGNSWWNFIFTTEHWRISYDFFEDFSWFLYSLTKLVAVLTIS